MSVSPPSVAALSYQIVQATPTAVTVIFRFSLSGGQQPYTISWDFGDGTSQPPLGLPVLVPGAGLSTTHDYPPSMGGASFRATLTVSDALNQRGSMSVTVAIPAAGAPTMPAPMVAAPAPPPPLVPPLAVAIGYKILQSSQTKITAQFAASVTGGTMPFSNLVWDFGDGTATVTAPSGVTHDYQLSPATTTFLVTATAMDITLQKGIGNVLVMVPSALVLAPPQPAVPGAVIAVGVVAVFAVAAGAYYLLRKPRK